MSLRLILMRHAKSSWNSGALTDHDRPLNKRGQRAAPKVAQALWESQWIPEQVLSSDARRTQETWQAMSSSLEDPPVQWVPELYLAGISEVRTAIVSQTIESQTLLLLGHNPGWEQVLEYLSGRAELLKTADAALLSSSAQNWQQALEQAGSFELHSILRARQLS